MPQQVMLYHSGMQGAPSATSVVLGGMIAILDACLVNGFNVNAISTLTRSGTVATATTSGTNGYAVGEWVDVSGAVETAYNGRVLVTGKPAVNQFTYDVAGSPATPATGAITSKYGAAGWTKTFAGTNTAAYRTLVGSSLGLYLQVEDNNPYADGNVSARVRGAESHTALDTAAHLGEQCRWYKANGNWIVVADHKRVYVVLGQPPSSSTAFNNGTVRGNGAGDIKGAYSGDPYAFYVSRGQDAPSYATVFPWPSAMNNNSTAYCNVSLLRTYTGLGASVYGSTPTASPVYGGYNQNGLFPSPVDNTVPMTPLYVYEIPLPTDPNNASNGGGFYRGQVPGVFFPVSAPGFSSYSAQGLYKLDPVVVDGVSRTVVLVRLAGDVSARCIGFDLGPSWD